MLSGSNAQSTMNIGHRTYVSAYVCLFMALPHVLQSDHHAPVPKALQRLCEQLCCVLVPLRGARCGNRNPAAGVPRREPGGLALGWWFRRRAATRIDKIASKHCGHSI